ncbi:MAG TPA: exodeoxyribonuclease VII small subunit [Acidobacteriota bacterium]|jgi:exodeoxyribonuclease VII small subunit|nr:exodeoxyribonuclease VII small subunit [Acidobacteriota bacterium]
MPAQDPADDLTFDEALEQLEGLARELEEGDIPLEQALQVYERAVGLFRACRDRLAGVEAKLELLTRDLDSEPLAPPAETGDG